MVKVPPQQGNSSVQDHMPWPAGPSPHLLLQLPRVPCLLLPTKKLTAPLTALQLPPFVRLTPAHPECFDLAVTIPCHTPGCSIAACMAPPSKYKIKKRKQERARRREGKSLLCISNTGRYHCLVPTPLRGCAPATKTTRLAHPFTEAHRWKAHNMHLLTWSWGHSAWVRGCQGPRPAPSAGQ